MAQNEIKALRAADVLKEKAVEEVLKIINSSIHKIFHTYM